MLKHQIAIKTWADWDNTTPGFVEIDSVGQIRTVHIGSIASNREKITYTRARETIKNDQPYVEQQNYSIVRRYAGYARLDTWEQLTTVNELYEKLSDYQNFFQSISKLKEKIRDGAKVTRRYYKAQTAYQRILARPDISEETKAKLTQRFLTINPKKLILEITALGRKLVKNR